MLEETLCSKNYSPAEVALTLISFVEVELAAGGASAEARFFKLFSLLCTRVFGDLSEKDDFKHETGSWLSRHVKWERPPMSVSSPHKHYGIPHRPATSSSLLNSDPVIKLLGARAASQSLTLKDQQHPLTLIEAFAKEAEHRPNVRFAFPFHALPKSTQDAWISLIEAALGGAPASETAPSENSSRLLGSLFRVKPLEQNQLKLYQQTKAQKKDHRRPLQLSPRYASPNKPSTAQPTPTKQKDSTPSIMLSMLEYYLLVFIRYPLVAPPSPPKQPNGTRPVPQAPVRRSEPYGDLVYYHLFQEYVNYYIPAGTPQGISNGFPSLQRPNELFIRTVIELWLEGQNQLTPTSKALSQMQERLGALATFDLNMSYDLVKAKYEPPTSQMSRCIHKLIARASSDGAILDAVRDIHSGYRGVNPEVLCLSPTMTILQLPFYNYIRNAFRHASIHAKQSPFYSALNDWLVWLEPWNTEHGKLKNVCFRQLILCIHVFIRSLTQPCLTTNNLGKKDPTTRIMDTVSRTALDQTSISTRVIYPRPNQRSSYKPCWEPYIASNLHLYTVPLAIFLRRARELDFSPREYRRSLNTVSRVFRVFSPEVVEVINKLLSARQSGHRFSGIVARHEKNLVVYAPPPSSLTLASCQDNMHNLLEEIYLQHLKKLEDLDIIDRTVAWIEGFFGQGAYTGEEKELTSLMEKTKVIVGFPADYEVIQSSKPRPTDSKARSLDAGNMDRSKNGLFSDTGRQQILSGTAKCNPQDIGYVGDKMLSRPQSHEIAFLVPMLINASTFVNTRLGIRSHDNVEGFDHCDSLIPKRFNFRFLADYRNIIFICLFSWFWKLTHS